jgi:hypothetical protein
MRFYKGAHRELYNTSLLPDYFDQHLYLVSDINNKYDSHAVMLHNGRQKLGSVTSTECHQIRELMKKWSEEDGQDSVVVCKISKVWSSQEDEFMRAPTIKVHGMQRVNERLARKFAAKNEKE